MKKSTLHKLIIIIALILTMPVASYAGERIGGSLVINTMKRIESRQREFQHDVRNIRSEREKAIREKAQILRRFRNTRSGSLDRKEAHSELAYAVAKIFKKSFEEFRLVRETASDHLQSLNALKSGLKSGGTGLETRATKKIVKDTSEFLQSSNTLLLSVGKYADLIDDPRLRLKLKSAKSTALLLERYVDTLDKNRLNTGASQRVLSSKVDELITHMEELYIQTDVLLDMLKTKTSQLKIINQIAVSDLAFIRLANGRAVVDSMSDEVLAPLKKVLEDSDNDLDILTEGVLDAGRASQQIDNNSWKNGLWQ